MRTQSATQASARKKTPHAPPSSKNQAAAHLRILNFSLHCRIQLLQFLVLGNLLVGTVGALDQTDFGFDFSGFFRAFGGGG